MSTIESKIRHELTGRKLCWNLFFYVGQTLLFLGAWYYRSQDQRLIALNKMSICFGIASGSALVLAFDGLLLLLPTLRNLCTLVRPALANWLPVDEGFFLHRQMAYAMLFWTVIHTSAHYINYIDIEISQVRITTAYHEMFMSAAGITGHVMLLIMFIMYTMSSKKIRTQAYESFYWTHHLGILFMLALYTHATGCFVRGSLPGQPVQCLGYSAWKYTCWTAGVYFIERVIRFIRSRRTTRIISTVHHPCDVLEIRFTKASMKYKPGQYIYLNCAELGKRFEWHPFSISSAPSDPYISLHIRQAGDFTKALSERLRNERNPFWNIAFSSALSTTTTSVMSSASSSASVISSGTSSPSLGSFKKRPSMASLQSVDVSLDAMLSAPTNYNLDNLLKPGKPFYYPKIRIDGPYGSPAQDVTKLNVAILVGAGIGVTPFASILKNIYHMHKNSTLGGLRHVHFVWVCRDIGSFTWFKDLLSDLENTKSLSGFLTISLYLTKIDEKTREQVKEEILQRRSVDTFTSLKSSTHFGRPNFKLILDKVRIDVEEGLYDIRRVSVVKKVGVFFCGPPALGKQLQKDSITATTSLTRFRFVKEKF